MSLIQEYGERMEKKGLDEGFDKGLDEGIEQGSSEVIVSFLKSGMSAEEISQRIGMSLEDILKIKEKYL